MIAGSRLITVASVCCALAVGVGLGAGPLQGDERAAAGSHRARGGHADEAYAEAFVAAAAPSLYARRLAGHSVAVVALPGADETVVKALTDQVVAAGGTVTSRTDVRESLTGRGQKAMVDALGAQLSEQVPGIVDASETTYPRLGRLLAASVATTGQAAAPGPQALTVRKSLAAGKLTSDPGTVGVAPLVLVVAGSDVEDSIVGGLVTGLAGGAHGVVVAGPSGSADLGVVHEAAAAVATVDGSETAAGRAAAVLALVHQITGGGGAYGASGIDGPAPLG